jgi:hypothetical protein
MLVASISRLLKIADKVVYVLKVCNNAIIHRYVRTSIDTDKIIPMADVWMAPLIESLDIIIEIGCCRTIGWTMVVEWWSRAFVTWSRRYCKEQCWKKSLPSPVSVLDVRIKHTDLDAAYLLSTRDELPRVPQAQWIEEDVSQWWFYY